MKISLVTLALCAILSRAEAGSRRNAEVMMAQPQNGLMNDGTDFSRMNSNSNYNMVRYQSNVITGSLSVRLEEIIPFILEKLQTLKNVFNQLGWTTLVDYSNKIIDYLSHLENEVPTDNRIYGRRFFGNAPPPRLCEPFDTRPQCRIVGYGR